MKIINNYFALEGLNGVGKSTISKIIEKKKQNDYIIFHDPDSEFDPKKNEYGKNLSKDDILSAKLYSISSYLTQKKHLPEPVDKKKIIFSDRSVISTCAYYDAIDPQWIREIHKYCYFPSTVFLIVADQKSIDSRLTSREVNKTELEIESTANQGLLDRYLKIAKIFKEIKFIKIKNIDGDPQASADLIISKIENTYGLS